jgi:hypothetical protein
MTALAQAITQSIDVIHEPGFSARAGGTGIAHIGETTLKDLDAAFDVPTVQHAL